MVVLFSVCIGKDVRCLETYAIDGHTVLLYKTINWWYDCLSEESNKLCGHHIKYEKTRSCRVEYNETQATLEFQINGNFAELLSVFKHCEKCFGPTYLKCTWLNKKYFGNGRPAVESSHLPTIGPFTMINVSQTYGRRIQDIEKDISFVLEGRIGGLLNGKIALYQEGDFLKTCQGNYGTIDEASPVFVHIIDSSTNAILAKYFTVLVY